MKRITLRRSAELFLLAIAAAFLLLHLVHLRADFPNHSPWMDWAKYTDEGWYGDAAIRHFQRGGWYVPGDFNPAAALPVWPLIEGAVFRVTGVNVVAARALTVAIFGLILASVYLLVRRWQGRSSLAPAVAVLLLAVSPYCYAFSRMAILEPMLILLTLLALLAASSLPDADAVRTSWFDWRRRALPSLALGLLLPLMILTKTTAIFLFPAIGWMVFARSGHKAKNALKVGAPIVALGILVWTAYYGLVVRPHFLSDYRYLFSANAYTGITAQNALEVLRDTFQDGMWVGDLLYPLGLLAMTATFFFRPQLLKNPLLTALLLWILGYLTFIAYHNNLQPRYYLVLAVPFTVVPVIVFASFWSQWQGRPTVSSVAGAIGAVALLIVAVTDAGQTISYVTHPEYTFASAADRIRQIVESDRTHNPLVLSISGSDLSLMTGLPSICDDFGTMELEDRVKVYRPGWYVTWNQVDDDKMDALTPIYHLKRVASFPAMDDPERNLMILYRLDPPEATPRRRSRPRPIPQFLRTGFGQQADPLQLQH
ncbi:glycosyltransferase family 39 protein [Edaphobacter albus]|uniref:glycosyltransferase family 39 protein n=1 Tax=Edaphobacter sp. 4G125 TaxID=2763071 RepID=UPI002102A76E|nr:glycosyltransferase family 39 protein [Edaphobacter sp. 4G125]